MIHIHYDVFFIDLGSWTTSNATFDIWMDKQQEILHKLSY